MMCDNENKVEIEHMTLFEQVKLTAMEFVCVSVRTTVAVTQTIVDTSSYTDSMTRATQMIDTLLPNIEPSISDIELDLINTNSEDWVLVDKSD